MTNFLNSRSGPVWAVRRRLRLRHRLGQAARLPVDALAWTPLGTVTHVATDEPLAALTFDDGPHPLYTPRLLDVLARHGARATFFVVGEQARRHPEIVARAAAEGHTIGNHTFSHAAVPAIPRCERVAELRACAAALGPHAGRLFRPPYGFQSVGSRLDALRLGYDVICWSLSAFDWQPREAGWMAEFMIRRITPGTIMLLHDRLHTADTQAAGDRTAMIAAVDALLAATHGRLRFVTVPELMQAGRPQRVSWYRPADAEWLGTQVAVDI